MSKSSSQSLQWRSELSSSMTHPPRCTLPAYSYYVRISAVSAQEPMSGMTVVVNEQGSKLVADKVIASSREHYAKKPDKDAKHGTTVPTPEVATTPKKSSRRKNTNHATKKAEDSLSNLKPVA